MANCLFVYSRAIIEAEKTGARIISPTWFNFAVGPYLRGQSDKRHYLNVFRREKLSGLRKTFLLVFRTKAVKRISGLNNYFGDLKGYSAAVRDHLLRQLSEAETARIRTVPDGLISLHIRLGDYKPARRVPLEWYISLIHLLREYVDGSVEISVFSDGTDEELSDVLALPNVHRRFYGSAFADIWALSRSTVIIASDSTFSAWGAYLGQVPTIFYKRHFPTVLDDADKELVIGDDIQKATAVLSAIFG